MASNKRRTLCFSIIIRVAIINEIYVCEAFKWVLFAKLKSALKFSKKGLPECPGGLWRSKWIWMKRTDPALSFWPRNFRWEKAMRSPRHNLAHHVAHDICIAEKAPPLPWVTGVHTVHFRRRQCSLGVCVCARIVQASTGNNSTFYPVNHVGVMCQVAGLHWVGQLHGWSVASKKCQRDLKMWTKI